MDATDPRCRACLEERPEKIRLADSVFVDEKSYPLTEVFVSCCNIEVYKDDQKPQSLCTDCVEEAKRCFKFRKSCQWSDVILQDELTDLLDVKEEKDCDEVNYNNTTQMDEEDDLDTKIDILSMQLLQPNITTNLPTTSPSSQEADTMYTELKEIISFKQTCKVCKQVFRSQSEYMHHHQSCPPDILQCKYCGFKTQTKSELEIHMQRHNDPEMMRRMCDICGRLLSSERCLKNHKKSVHDGTAKPPLKTYNCNICKCICDRVADIVRHYKERHEETTEFLCTECGRNIEGLNTYDRHLRGHRRQIKNYNCDFCEYTCTRKNDLRTHMMNHPKKNKPYKCPHCERSFNQKFLYNCHLVVHTKKYQCDRCESSCTGIANIIQHYKENHANDKALPCADCDQVFNTLDDLEKHFYGHSRYGRVYNCVSCGFSCTRKDDLRAHMVQHPKTKPFMCEHCGRQFSQKTAYNCHLILHTKKFRHYCKECNKGFVDRQQQQRHQRLHDTERKMECTLVDGQKQFPCTECGRVFNRRSRLKSHWQMHTGEKPHQCKICGKNYTQMRNVVWHMAKFHAVDKDGLRLDLSLMQNEITTNAEIEDEESME